MALTDGVGPSTLQFVADALRTMNASEPALDMTKESNRQNVGRGMLRSSGHAAVRNADGTALTIAQIATAANLTTDQVTEMANRVS